ncbi:MAG: NAD(P)/FAD-dependent oxidoreductase [Alphaproteobacteria bacterium]|nr:NAD(P)/FAD-dependent oxidoreductase [Alphaproteobacteria bacterium]
MTTHTTDIVIIGAGPVGLFAAFEAGMLKMRCHIVDALDFAGGQCVALYPEKPIYDIPGYPQIEAQELITQLKAQAAPFAPTYHLGQRVERVTPDGARWKVRTSAGIEINCGAIIIAAGCGAFGPNRPPLEHLAEYEASKAVQYMVGKREEFRGKRIVIAGGGDSAVDWAVSLAEIARHIMVVHRRPKFRAAPDMVSKMEALAAAGKIEMVIPYQLHALEGKNGVLENVVVQSLEGESKHLKADVLLPFFGLAMELGPIADWGLDLDKSHIAVDAATCATSAPGIYAVGDIATYPGKLKLILCGFSEAAMAIHAARAHLHPGEVLHFEYSTTQGVPA